MMQPVIQCHEEEEEYE